MTQLEQSVSAIRVWKGYLVMAMGGPRFHNIMAKPCPTPHWPKRLSFGALIAAKHALFLTPFSFFIHGSIKMDQVAQFLAAIRVWKWYLEMVTACPFLQEILTGQVSISQRPKRTSHRSLIAAKRAIFLTPIFDLLPARLEMVKIEQSLSAIRAWQGYIEIAIGRSAFPGNRGQVSVNLATSQSTLLSPPIAARACLFLAPFPSFLQGGY